MQAGFLNRILALTSVFALVGLAVGLISPAPAEALTTCCSVYAPTETPTTIDALDATGPVELGMMFQVTSPGVVSGVRFWKSTGNTGTHDGHLWASDGTLLASVTFSGETASGWQEATFSSPISVATATDYVISYHTDNGHYSYTTGEFTSPRDVGKIHIVTDAGYYLYGASSSFPNAQTGAHTGYSVDVVYTPQPTANATVGVSVDPLLTFTTAGYNSGTCNGASVSSSTSSASAISIGRVTTAVNAVAGQLLTVSTNSANGYTTYVRAGGGLAGPGHTMTAWTGTNGAPSAFPSAGNEAIGYTTDHALSGSANRFASNKWAGLPLANEELAYATGVANTDTTHFCLQLGASPTTPAGSYTTSVIYTVVPKF